MSDYFKLNLCKNLSRPSALDYSMASAIMEGQLNAIWNHVNRPGEIGKESFLYMGIAIGNIQRLVSEHPQLGDLYKDKITNINSAINIMLIDDYPELEEAVSEPPQEDPLKIEEDLVKMIPNPQGERKRINARKSNLQEDKPVRKRDRIPRKMVPQAIVASDWLAG